MNDSFIHIIIPLSTASSSNTLCHADPRSVKKCWKLGHPHHKKSIFQHPSKSFFFLLEQTKSILKELFLTMNSLSLKSRIPVSRDVPKPNTTVQKGNYAFNRASTGTWWWEKKYGIGGKNIFNWFCVLSQFYIWVIILYYSTFFVFFFLKFKGILPI